MSAEIQYLEGVIKDLKKNIEVLKKKNHIITIEKLQEIVNYNPAKRGFFISEADLAYHKLENLFVKVPRVH